MEIRQVVMAWGLATALAGASVQARAARLVDGTPVRVRLTADLLSAQAKVGAPVNLEVAQPVMLQGVVVVPEGAGAWGAVQAVKKGKILHFDVEGMRLPNKQIILLRCAPQKKAGAKKEEFKVESTMNGQLGAPQGSEFTAYLDQDVNIDLSQSPAAPAEPVPATPAPTPPVPAQPLPAQSAPTRPTPAVAADPAVRPENYILVGCFSDPPGADIRVDGELRERTPLIIKLPPGNHQVEFRLRGYKPQSQPLVLMAGTGLHTVRMILEKQP